MLRVESIVAGGDGLAGAPDGRVAFVARAAAGELVEVEYTEEHKQWLRGRLLRVLERSPARREAACPYYARCGGCQLQHIAYDAQLSAKSSIIAESLRRIGGLELTPPQVVPSGRELGYRNRISLVMRRSGADFVAGYHAYDDPADVVGVDSCPIAEPAVNAAWSSLVALWRREPERLPKGRELRLTLRASFKGEVGLAVEEVREGARPADRRAQGEAGRRSPSRGRGRRGRRSETDKSGGETGRAGEARGGAAEARGGAAGVKGLVGSAEGLVAVWWMDARGRIAGREGARSLSEQVGPYRISLEGTAFLQVNREAAARLNAYVRAQCGQVDNKRVVDAYCGHGVRAIDMARDGGDVTGIDMDRGAIAAGGRLAAETGARLKLVAAAVEHSLRRELPADVAILNPPRRGVARPVTDALAAAPAGRVIYVSCNPATLARDLGRLAAAYEIADVRAFDLFPQTAHVETVVTLRRRPR